MVEQASSTGTRPLLCRFARTDADLDAARALRFERHFGRPGRDGDRFDTFSQHILVERPADGRLMGCARVRLFDDARQAAGGYTGQFYDLTRLDTAFLPVLELGRFTVADDPDPVSIVRMIWAAITQLVDSHAVGLLFGCASFDGADAARHGPAWAHLAAKHLGAGATDPRVLAADRFDLRDFAADPDPRRTLAALPPLMRTYLAMGGKVSSGGVIDRDMDTCHVFTSVAVAAIPPARQRLLRADALDLSGGPG